VTTQLNGFENQLKRDLMIAAQSGILDQTYSENIAIVANIDKFDVRIISSNSSSIQSSNNSSGIGIVGMSNLVGVMLETVHSLALSGASEFQCLSYIESKLKEIYHLSEALASLLLETEFCTLNILSTSLNLSINDIPLLISIASVHTPSISKRYGISFR
jgi:folliculin-interacting protein 2